MASKPVVDLTVGQLALERPVQGGHLFAPVQPDPAVSARQRPPSDPDDLPRGEEGIEEVGRVVEA